MFSNHSQPVSVNRAFEEQARLFAESPALMFGDDAWSYRSLNHRANQIARFLLSAGIAQGARIALCLERSPELIAVLIAILKTGGVYVPLDPSYPAERLAFMLADSGASLLITQRKFAPLFGDAGFARWGGQSGVTRVLLSECQAEIEGQPGGDLELETEEGSAAYLMYTSGSTGIPKGALIPHRGILRLVKGADYVHFGSDEVFLQMAPASFDASTFEIWGAILNGSALAMMPAGVYSLAGIGAALARYRVSTLWLTAGLFHLMVEQRLEDFRPLRQLIAGGDTLSPTHVRRVLERWPKCAVVNGYGPTETTTFACCHRIALADLDQGSVPIGKPINRTTVYILDGDQKPVARGEEGEIYIGGDGVACGYVNRPELTRERFVSDPFRPGHDANEDPRLYRTGDLGRMRADGCVEFLGRLDGQLKINGFRVEPGEIEANLMRHPLVTQAAVVVRPDRAGKKRMVAYAVGTIGGAFVNGGSLRAFLATKLPAQMVPAQIVMVASLPLTANGKVDRSLLPPPSADIGGRALTYPDPADLAEEIILGAWQKALGQDEIEPDRNFFDLGGDSLRLMAVHAEIQRAWKQDFPLLKLLEYPTVRSFAVWLRGGCGNSGLIEVKRRALGQREALLNRLG